MYKLITCRLEDETTARGKSDS